MSGGKVNVNVRVWRVEVCHEGRCKSQPDRHHDLGVHEILQVDRDHCQGSLSLFQCLLRCKCSCCRTGQVDCKLLTFLISWHLRLRLEEIDHRRIVETCGIGELTTLPVQASNCFRQVTFQGIFLQCLQAVNGEVNLFSSCCATGQRIVGLDLDGRDLNGGASQLQSRIAIRKGFGIL